MTNALLLLIFLAVLAVAVGVWWPVRGDAPAAAPSAQTRAFEPPTMSTAPLRDLTFVLCNAAGAVLHEVSTQAPRPPVTYLHAGVRYRYAGVRPDGVYGYEVEG